MLEAGSGGNGEGSRTVLQEEGVLVSETGMVDERQKTPIISLVRKSSRHIREPDRFQEMLNFYIMLVPNFEQGLFKNFCIFPNRAKDEKLGLYIFIFT